MSSRTKETFRTLTALEKAKKTAATPAARPMPQFGHDLRDVIDQRYIRPGRRTHTQAGGGRAAVRRTKQTGPPKPWWQTLAPERKRTTETPILDAIEERVRAYWTARPPHITAEEWEIRYLAEVTRMSAPEIAALITSRTGVLTTEGAVRVRLHRARRASAEAK